MDPITIQEILEAVDGKLCGDETDLSMTQIAQLLGFSSLSYFSQVFRRTQSVSPLEYRQSTKNIP